MTAAADLWLAVPILLWFAGYAALLVYFVPRMRDRSKVSSEARSALMGRIVDSYTNILTVKLFARAARRGQLRARRGRSPRRRVPRRAAAADGVRQRCSTCSTRC